MHANHFGEPLALPLSISTATVSVGIYLYLHVFRCSLGSACFRCVFFKWTRMTTASQTLASCFRLGRCRKPSCLPQALVQLWRGRLPQALVTMWMSWRCLPQALVQLWRCLPRMPRRDPNASIAELMACAARLLHGRRSRSRQWPKLERECVGRTHSRSNATLCSTKLWRHRSSKNRPRSGLQH